MGAGSLPKKLLSLTQHATVRRRLTVACAGVVSSIRLHPSSRSANHSAGHASSDVARPASRAPLLHSSATCSRCRICSAPRCSPPWLSRPSPLPSRPSVSVGLESGAIGHHARNASFRGPVQFSAVQHAHECPAAAPSSVTSLLRQGKG